jgi:intein/homing endonuclease
MPLTSVKKRDGRIVPFDQSRIANAIAKAMQAIGEGDLSRDPQRVSERAVKELEKKFAPAGIPSIEEIQDIVEESLILMDFPKAAKAYILYRQERAQIREKTKQIPEPVKKLVAESKKYFRNPLAEFIYYRSYSRWIENEGRRETWIETVDRYVNFMRDNLGKHLTDDEYQEIKKAILNQEVMPSMRLMWSAGQAAKATNVSVYNCSYIAPTRLEDFAEIMYLLMCGAGVGFSVESQTVQRLPMVERQTGKKLPIHTVQDNKEGWGDALTAGLKAWYGGKDIDFDFSKLRPRGARLKTMGGRSSGPEPLKAFLETARVKILNRQGKRLSNLDIHDIICKISEIVEMGGVRRAALISLSDLDDEEMRRAKTGQFYITEPQRMMANNSAVYNAKPTSTQFMEEWLALAKNGTGERGIFNRGDVMTQIPERRRKRFAKDAATSGTNPCIAADTWVTTLAGAKQVKDLVNKPFTAIVNGASHFSQTGFFATGKKPVLEIKTKRGFSFKATGNHKVLVLKYRSRKMRHNVWKQVSDLKIGDELVLHNQRGFSWGGIGTESEGWLLGNLIGDGNIEKNRKVNLDFWGEQKKCMMTQAVSLIHSTVGGRSDLKGRINKWGVARAQSANFGLFAANYGLRYGGKVITEQIEKSSSEFYRGFLRGWFDADGSIQGLQQKGVSVRLTSVSLKNLQAAQRMLARLGIISAIYQNRRLAQKRFLPDGHGGRKEYTCQPYHELIISGANLKIFAELINFSDLNKREKLEFLLAKYRRRLNKEKFSTAVVSVSPVGTEIVYDCQIPNVNQFDGNGISLHNCGEIILRSKSFCNLSEVVARPEDTEETLRKKVRIAAILGTYQSTLTNFPYLSKEWKKNCEEERLLGVSITGQWDCPTVRRPEILKTLKELAIEINKEYAKRFGINQSAAVTCVKPSGTVSQLIDSASGMHPRHSQYYIRRIRISVGDPLFQMLKDQKFPYHPEVGQSEVKASTYVLEFPIKSPDGAVLRNDLSAIDQLEYWKLVKENYTEHNPSVTVSVGANEWIETANWLYANWDIIGGLSFLPRSEHVYLLAPYEEITEEKYKELVSKLPDADFSQIIAYEREDMTAGAKELACVGGICEIDLSS